MRFFINGMTIYLHQLHTLNSNLISKYTSRMPAQKDFKAECDVELEKTATENSDFF